jgi:hypothetical protein
MGEAGQHGMLQPSQLVDQAALMRALVWPNRLTHQELMASR